MVRRCAIVFVLGSLLSAQTILDDAYAALRAGDLDTAAQRFTLGLEKSPGHRNARKDYAYTLLKLGDTDAARNEFGEVYRQDSRDVAAGLEFAFLSFETKRRTEARRVFAAIRDSATGAERETAAAAFSRIESALQQAMAQWRQAAEEHPESDSVHAELARLAEEHDEPAVAMEAYRRAWQAKPSRREYLLDIGRAAAAAGLAEESAGALTAALRSDDARTAEKAREALGEADITPAIEREARRYEPSRALLTARTSKELSAFEMGERSYDRGYLKDARRYYQSALESDPTHARARLRLGWVHNLLGEDALAYQQFGQARRSRDPAVAEEAGRAWRNLREQQAPLRPTLWILPMFSSRWRSAFAYGQAKIEMNRPGWWVRPYVSLRFAGDTGARQAPAPLSERALTPALGVTSRLWNGLVGWAEMGTNLGHTRGADRRAGVSFTRGIGHLMGAETPGRFWLTTTSMNYASRFQHNILFSSQHYVGYTFGRWQVSWLSAAGADTRTQWWGNFVEFGPAIRYRAPWLPQQMTITAELVRGFHTVLRDNPHGRNYVDLRVGLWYAFTY